MNDLVSVVMPLYNAENFIESAIESLLRQSYENWELIVIDDASTDGGTEIVKKSRKHDSRIGLLELKENRGPAVARNEGIRKARGRYIAFLDADDRWLPGKLEWQLAFMQERGAALSYTGYYRIEEESGRRIDRIRVPSSVDYRELLKQNIIGCLTAMYDTRKLGKVTMPLIRKRQDFALWLKILKRIPAAYGLDEALAEYRVRRGDSVSSNKLRASLYNWRLYREIENLPFPKALYYFGWYTYRSLKKYKGNDRAKQSDR